MESIHDKRTSGEKPRATAPSSEGTKSGFSVPSRSIFLYCEEITGKRKKVDGKGK
jgi:hypothetical protein